MKKRDAQNGPNLAGNGGAGVWRQGNAPVKRLYANLNGVLMGFCGVAQAGKGEKGTLGRATAKRSELDPEQRGQGWATALGADLATDRAEITERWEPGKESRILWMPQGRHKIHCCVGGKPAVLDITVRKEVVEALNVELEEMWLQGNRGFAARPRADYGHVVEGPNSGSPKRFEWEAGRGVVLVIAWTAAAARGIRDGEWTYWSPQFRFAGDPDGPVELAGLSGISVGGLVNDPAFESMEPVTAGKETSGGTPEPQTQKNLPGGDSSGTNKNKQQTMNYTKIIGVLVALGALSQAQADADDGPALEAVLKQWKAGEASMKEEVEALRAEAAKARKARAEGLVADAVKAGRMQDGAEGREFWVTALSGEDEAGRVKAEKALASLGPVRVAPAPTGATAEKVQPGVADGAVTTEQVAQAARGEKLKAMALRNMSAHPGMAYPAAWALAEAELEK